MITLYNALGADGALYTYTLEKNFFSDIKKQTSFEKSLSSKHIPLEDLGTSLLDEKDDWLCNARGELLVPGAIDCHVHSREPGFTYKETWKTLGQSAFKGGVTTIIDMPNTNPATLDRDTVLEKMAVANTSRLNYKFLLGVVDSNLPMINSLLDDKDLPLAGVKVYYGKSTGNLLFDNLEALSPIARRTSKVFVFHCEQQEIIEENTKLFAEEIKKARTPEDFIIHSKVRSSKAAIKATETVLNWALTNKTRVHIAHVSTPEEIRLVEKAKKKSSLISCEVAPHHLHFSDKNYSRYGGRIKVNPPVRSEAERNELLSLLAQGKADCFATDHAPHSSLEKDNYYTEVPAGIPALEIFWPLLYQLSKKAHGTVPLEKLIPLVTLGPASIFGFKDLAGFYKGTSVNMVHLDEKEWTLTSENLIAKCGWSPYIGFKFSTSVKQTWCRGERVY
jgi:dihydroorotase